jgi:hypothetical protein
MSGTTVHRAMVSRHSEHNLSQKTFQPHFNNTIMDSVSFSPNSKRDSLVQYYFVK